MCQDFPHSQPNFFSSQQRGTAPPWRMETTGAGRQTCQTSVLSGTHQTITWHSAVGCCDTSPLAVSVHTHHTALTYTVIWQNDCGTRRGKKPQLNTIALRDGGYTLYCITWPLKAACTLTDVNQLAQRVTHLFYGRYITLWYNGCN